MPPKTIKEKSDVPTDLSVKLAQIELDMKVQEWKHQIQRMRIKWISFTGAILLAVIGAVGGWQQGWFNFTLEKDDSDTQQFSDISKIERDYLDRYIKHALDEDLQYRSDFALYVSKTAITGQVRTNWGNYYTAVQILLEQEQIKLAQKAEEVDNLRKDESGNSAKIAALEAEILALNTRIQGTSIQRSEKPAKKFTPLGVTDRNSNVELLHPELRTKVSKLLQRLNSDGHVFELFEGFRSPFRQELLYEKGRATSGQKVTNASPWQSAHNYGLAADLVLKVNGKWSWQTDGQYKLAWRRLHELAREEGLEPLSFELPHVQLPGLSTAVLANGQYPDDGGNSWTKNLSKHIALWKQFRASQAPPEPIGTDSVEYLKVPNE